MRNAPIRYILVVIRARLKKTASSLPALDQCFVFGEWCTVRRATAGIRARR